jgi:hypothetical protein
MLGDDRPAEQTCFLRFSRWLPDRAIRELGRRGVRILRRCKAQGCYVAAVDSTLEAEAINAAIAEVLSTRYGLRLWTWGVQQYRATYQSGFPIERSTWVLWYNPDDQAYRNLSQSDV